MLYVKELHSDQTWKASCALGKSQF